ncbi:hypothetical protein N7478_005230 [Penicillium angulare]|uniref:uncharacterized protein n=1 Tax=Penicillium angulare TaxID=116970 RepID=UPI002541E360|nr:uncharacterized protein N7478_005230 [Penicillium angulare]KAJ5279858.1 hypothetical protein N7478_005230 [Penicillium angulare]
MASNDVVTKKADISETPQVDLEAESSSPDEKDWVYKSDRAESAELTQVEAFSWNVEGDQSPFPEVAACVSNKDDSTIKCNTFTRNRLCCGPNPGVPYWSGMGEVAHMDCASMEILNPGKFTVTEQAFIVICVNISASIAYALGSMVAIESPVY